MMNTWISGRKAAEALGISYTTVHRWIKLGKLQPIGYIDGVSVAFDRAYIERVAAQIAAERRAEQVETQSA